MSMWGLLLWRAARRALWVTLPIAAIYFLLLSIGLAPALVADCTTKSEITSDPAGLDFEARETECLDGAKHYEILVHAKEEKNKAVMFKYRGYEFPLIRVLSNGHILISLQSVSIIDYQRRDWNNNYIWYHID